MTGPPYRPLDAQVIPRFAGIRTFMRAPHVTDLAGVDAVVYGIPFDTATSYRTGPRFGPEAIRSASSLLRPYNPALDVNVVEALSIVDYGDVPVSPGRHGADVRAGRGGARADRRGRRLRRCDSAATTRSRSPSCARSRSATGRSRSSSSTRTATPGSSTSGSSTSTARRSSARSRRGCSTQRASVQAGMRGSLYGAEDIEARASSASPCSRPTSCATLGPRRYGELVREHGRRRGRCSSRSTSTSSTRRSRPARARPRSAASRPPRRSRSCARCAASSSQAATSSRCRRPTTGRAW